MTRPLLISDCDEVLLHMVRHFATWLDEAHDIEFRYDSWELAKNMRRRGGAALTQEEMFGYLGGFFPAEMARQTLVPHAGGWRDAGIVAEAIRFTAPLRFTTPPAGPGSLASVDDPNLVLDTVKRAEDSDALVLRLYEAHGARGTARLRLARTFAEAVRANVLEDELGPLERDGDAIVLAYRPHQLLTVVVR